MKKEARFYIESDGKIRCSLCPHRCTLEDGGIGQCGVRFREGSRLYMANYGEISSISVDPIEKKPLYHFKPASDILSVGSFGCNLRCSFCQNHSISMEQPETRFISPEKLLELAKDAEKRGSVGIAFTYNEPVLSSEFILDFKEQPGAENIDVVLVTNGFMTEEVLKSFKGIVRAMNIDLKSFSNDFYRKICKGEVEAVKATIAAASEFCHVEVTTLVIEGYNDSSDEIYMLCSWLSEIDRDIPLHLSAYHPSYKLSVPATSGGRIHKLAEEARKHLNFVYPGNVMAEDCSTYCPDCGELLIERHGWDVNCLIESSRCPQCGRKLNIVL